MNATTLLAVFAKWPECGTVKTRIAAATCDEFAADVARALLADTLHRLRGVAAERWLVHSPDGADAWADMTCGWRLTPQGTGDLGQRLRRFIAARLAEGAERIVILGADSPTLPAAYVEDALARLKSADVVLGPATDGGYYLLGVSKCLPPIFDEIAWGSNAVLAQTVARLSASSRLQLLPPWYDVDTLDDWRLLAGHVAALRRAGVDPDVPCIEKLLLQNRDREGVGAGSAS